MFYVRKGELVLLIIAFGWTIDNSLSALHCEVGISLEDENDIEDIILKVEDLDEDFESCDAKDELRCRLLALFEVVEWVALGNLTYGNFDAAADALCEGALDLGYENIDNKQIRTMYRLCSKSWQTTSHVIPRKLCCDNGSSVPCKNDKRTESLLHLQKRKFRIGDSNKRTIKCEVGAFLENDKESSFLYKFSPVKEEFSACEESQELLCNQLAKQKVIKSTDNGDFSIPVDENEGYTFGDVLCDKADDDIRENLRHQTVCIFYRFCDEEWKRTNYQFPQKLCCEDGLQVPCKTPQKPLVSNYFWFK